MKKVVVLILAAWAFSFAVVYRLLVEELPYLDIDFGD